MRTWTSPVVSLLAILSVGIFTLGHAEDTKQYQAWIAYYKAHDPVADARQNFREGHIFVLSAMGVGQFYPGINDAEGRRIERQHGVKHLKATSDIPEGKVHSTYMETAEAWAAKYNQTTVELLK